MRRKANIECPLCGKEGLDLQKIIETKDFFECFLYCRECGLELVGRRDKIRQLISKKKSKKKKYQRLFKKSRAIREGNNDNRKG